MVGGGERRGFVMRQKDEASRVGDRDEGGGGGGGRVSCASRRERMGGLDRVIPLLNPTHNSRVQFPTSVPQ